MRHCPSHRQHRPVGSRRPQPIVVTVAVRPGPLATVDKRAVLFFFFFWTADRCEASLCVSVCVRCVRVCVREQCPAGKERVAVLGLDMGLHGDWSEFVQAFFLPSFRFCFLFLR